MKWFYMDAGREAGPFDKDRMQELVQSGEILKDTLVRNDGNLDWTTYGQLLHMSTRKPSGQPGLKAPEDEGAGTATDHHTEICSQCGDVYDLRKLANYKGNKVCSLCAPSLLEQVGQSADRMQHAGFWVRFMAKMLDGLILLIPLAALNISIALMVPDMDISGNFSGDFTPASIAGLVLFYLLQVAIPMCYSTFFVGRYAATPGKLALGLRIILPDGGRVSYARALGRHFAEFLSKITLYAGYIMAGFDTEKRALHDHVAGTRVVLKQSVRTL